jgi:hypothetical protein
MHSLQSKTLTGIMADIGATKIPTQFVKLPLHHLTVKCVSLLFEEDILLR